MLGLIIINSTSIRSVKNTSPTYLNVDEHYVFTSVRSWFLGYLLQTAQSWANAGVTEDGHCQGACRHPLAKKIKLKFSIEYSIGFLLMVFYRIFANSFL